MEKTYTQEEVGYILELVNIQSELLNGLARERGYDLHDFGDLVTSIWESETLNEAWEEDGGIEYPYWSDLYKDTELVKEAIEKLNL